MFYLVLTGMYSVHSIEYTKKLFKSNKTEIIKNENDSLKNNKGRFMKIDNLKEKNNIMKNKMINKSVNKTKTKSKSN